MKRGILAAALASCVLLSGCAALLERSYSMVEPYADRYWDSGAEDTLKVDNYQDLVNSLLMLVEQRAEEAVIRCCDEVSTYRAVAQARSEVRWETMQGSYLLQNIQFSFEDGSNYGTAAFRMAYREDAEDLEGIMTLSDSQSLVDLLRLAVREDHEKLTARFTFDTPKEAVYAAVESYWQELCREEMEEDTAALQDGAQPDVPPAEGETVPEDGGAAEDTAEEAAADEPEETAEDVPEETAENTPEDHPEGEAAPAPEDGAPPEEPSGGEQPASGVLDGEPDEPEPIVYPPCPWTVRFYPNREAAELVEILLQKS